VAKGNPKKIRSIEDLARDDVKTALANPDAASVGRQTRRLLQDKGWWDEISAAVRARGVMKPTVNEVANDVKIGSRVKVQNNVSIYTGCEVEDEVFLGPSCVLTNVTNPRSQVNRHSLYEKTLFRRGCSIGANATIVPGVTIGRYAFIGAGAVVTKDVPDYALILGNPGKQKGWMSRHGHVLKNPDSEGVMVCPESGYRYRLSVSGDRETLKCLDLDEEESLPDDLSSGSKTYDEFKKE